MPRFSIKEIISKIKSDQETNQETKNAAIGLFEAAETWGIFSTSEQATKVKDLITRGTTTVLMYYLYRQGFEFFRFGYASAIAFLLFVIILVMSVLQIKYLSPKFEF